jgi:predicted RNA-binding Zn ribbon-like protein
MGVIDQAAPSAPARSWMGRRSTLDVRPAAVLSIFLVALAVVATVLISAGDAFAPGPPR